MKAIIQITANGVAMFGLLSSFAVLLTGGPAVVALGVGLVSLVVLASGT